MMHCRTPDHFWSQFARPFIFVPASFLSDHDGNLGENEKPRISEILPADTDTLLASSSTMSTFPSNLPYLTSDMPTGDNLLVPSAEKSTVRGRLRRARLADRKGVRRAEDIPEYKGQMSVDDLVEFINNSGRTTSRKDSTKRRATTRNNIARNDSKRRPRDFGEAGSKDEVAGGKVTEEIDAEVEKGHEKEQKIDSVGNMGVVDQEDAVFLDLDTGNDVWNDFTVVSRRRKGKTRFDRDNSPNDVSLTIDAAERAELNRGNSPNEINLTSGAKVMLKEKDISKEANLTSDAKCRPLKGEDSLKEANLTSQVNQSCPQVERIRNLNGDKQSKALRSEIRSPDSIQNAHNPTDQDLPSREGTVALDRADKVNPALNEAYLSSQNGSSISSQKLSQHSENKKRHRNTHETTGGHDCESEVSPENGTQSLSTKEIASNGNSETKRQPSKSGYLCPPVVFTDRNRTNFKELVDISFGFDVQDSESGFELGNCIDSAMKNCSSGSNYCRCSQADVKGCETDTKTHDTKSQSVLPTNNGSDKNNNACEVTSNATLRSGNCGDPERKKMVPPSASLLISTTTCHQNSTSGNGKTEKHSGDSTKMEKGTTTDTCTSQNTASAKENQDRLSSDKIEAQRVNCIASSKKYSTVPVKTKRLTNSVSIEVPSIDPFAATANATSLSSTGRPISIVAPNQMSRLLFSSGQSSCSGYGSLGSSGHSESSSSVKSDCSTQSFCSSLVHCSHSSSCHGVSSAILGPCARAPVVKVAPMLMEKFISNESVDATTECKSSSYCEESVLEDDHRPDDECIHESNLLTVGCDITKLKSAVPCQNKVQTQELFSGKIDCDIHNNELLLHKVDCDFIEQETPLCLHGTTNFTSATMSDTTGTEVRQGKHFNPPGNVFHLLSAQIYLYKSYLDSCSDLHEVYEEVPATNQIQDPME